jgi:DNA gyrase/topoisomerase IV subunit A
MERPDLSQAKPEIRAYIEALEAEIEQLRSRAEAASPEAGETSLSEPPLEPSEPPTTFNLITIAASGLAKRTPRHLYGRQRRGGMGVFDLDTPDDDPPAALIVADERDHLLIITNRARAFRLPVYFLNESAVRARPQPFMESLSLEPGERWAIALPMRTQGYLAVLSERGYVRTWPAHLFAETMRTGMSVLKPDEFGAPAAAGWAASDGDLFIATRQGLAVRFPIKSVPMQGAPGIRLDAAHGDAVVAIVGVRADSGVFLLGADGKGTIRLMSGFSANKAPGAGGKIAMKADRLVGAVTVKETDDLFVISRLSKIIRFKANEVPAKDGVVQGVHCMALRADETTALCISPAT